MPARPRLARWLEHRAAGRVCTAMITDEAVREFLIESHEGLDQLDRDFIALESDPTASDRIASIFRTVHTIKGSSGLLGYTKLEALAHAGESLLVLLRDGTRPLTPEVTSLLLALVDRVRVSLKAIEADGREASDANTDLLQKFAALRGAVTEQATAQRPAAALAPAGERPAPGSATGSGARASNESVVPAVSDSNVRVDVGLLDRLMNLVGELVLARNQMLQFGACIEDISFVAASQRLNLVTTELQEQVMRTRMQPIGNVWSKLPRVVRDLAVSCGKQVRVEMIGKETELDRTIIEAIKDPLTHVVRNAIDHGLEAPAARAERNKPRTGTLSLRAYHEGGQVNIEIADDGGGLDLDAIKRKALERGLASPEQLSQMSDYELAHLIFLPGFSTAEKVTNVSGRGVGMDVVKTNIERIGGTVDLSSRRGAGTTLKIRIPLTLAIVPALVVVSEGQRFAIPQTNLLELVRLDGDDLRTGVEAVHGAPVYRLRGQLLPLIYLSRALEGVEPGRRPGAQTAAPKARGEQPVNIIVLQAGEGQIGLVVDEIRDTEEIVVKPLGKELRGISVFAGATIMGDGRVALILDVAGLAQHVGVASRTSDTALGAREGHGGTAIEAPSVSRKEALLLFTVGRAALMAVPLSLVSRIEEFPRDRLEHTGSTAVLQYRGEVLPLIELAESSELDGDSSGTITVIVYSENGRSVGFAVGRVLDVLEDDVVIERSTARPGVLGAAIVQGRVTEMLDVHGLIRSRAPWFYEEAAA